MTTPLGLSWLELGALVIGTALVLSLLLGLWVWRNVRRVRLPADATFLQAMRLTPLSVVLLLDVLDLALDFFGAPVGWLILSRLGLTKLRAASALEALIPGTQAIPTMTLAWILIRLLGPRIDEEPRLAAAIDRGAQRKLSDIEKRPRR